MKKLLIALSLTIPCVAYAHTGITSKTNKTITPSFDIVKTQLHIDGPNLVFSQILNGQAGKIKPNAIGKLAGSDVFSYVWPTTLDSSVVGFEKKQGILALVLTAHPDFDDTPRYDENNDGNKSNDGNLWHSHWVVLSKDDACGKDGLKVRDIPKGSKPRLPNTWPGLPILLDSPGYEPNMVNTQIEIKVPLKDIGFQSQFQFDGVTAGLRVNASVHNPLLCVVKVHDIASGDLSLPGKIKSIK